jgi:hypothetical protein
MFGPFSNELDRVAELLDIGKRNMCGHLILLLDTKPLYHSLVSFG